MRPTQPDQQELSSVLLPLAAGAGGFGGWGVHTRAVDRYTFRVPALINKLSQRLHTLITLVMERSQASLLLWLACAACAAAQKPSLAMTPPMGWMSWEVFRCETDCAKNPDACINERLYKQMANALQTDGYVAAGYRTISIDDCW